MNNFTFFNETIPEDDHFIPFVYRQPLKKGYEILLTALLAVIMLAMGSTMTAKQIKLTFKQPWGVIIGMICQFIILPLSAFGLIHAFHLPPYSALGFLILACCPGGTVSNILTYWVRGDVSLSICMTTASTIMAFGMMPLNLWIYSRTWTTESTLIPFVKIFIALASIACPVGVGMIIKWKLPKIADFIVKAGSISGVIAILVSILIQCMLYPRMFNANWNLWICAFLFPMVGYGLGYLFAFICKRSPAQCRTIAFETGCQNGSLCFTLISLTFPVDIMGQVNLFPLLYALFLLSEAFITVGVYRCYFKFHPRSNEIADVPN